MTKLLIACALLAAAGLSAPAAALPFSQADDCCEGDPTFRAGVADPRAYVIEMYRFYQAEPNGSSPNSGVAYSRRLRALVNAYDEWTRQHGELVGALDFDWWTNAQDYSISNVAVTKRNPSRSRRWIVARFDNYDRHDEVRFLFIRQGRRWYLDDAVHGSGRGAEGWTLSALLRERPRP
ncbi:MAG: hypothetical protein QOD42_1710 [Sphingomonadales bacterium]|jgi:hypothetical protein|nr:hypothetical protein [Sphingomonadales bacterium]